MEIGTMDKSTSASSITAKFTEESGTYNATLWLALWMACNILVTLSNKAIFAKVDFKYPYALSTVHMACNLVGAQMYFYFNRTIKPKIIEPSNNRIILYFSVLFSLNIAIGNTSLSYVSVNFNQVSRALVPVVVMLISIVYFGKTYSTERKVSVIPIVGGAAMALYGEMSYTLVGALHTWFCVLLAALKAVVSGELLTGDLRLHPVDLLLKMCPLALLQIGFLSIATGEASAIAENWESILASSAPGVILFSGVLSFLLNVSSFIANKSTSALTLCICANVKQVALVLAGTLYFGDSVSMLNALGIIIAFLGSLRYGIVSINEKTPPPSSNNLHSPPSGKSVSSQEV